MESAVVCKLVSTCRGLIYTMCSVHSCEPDLHVVAIRYYDCKEHIVGSIQI